MNISKAKEQVKGAVRAYLTRDDLGNYEIPVEKQRPLLLIGPPGIGKTAIMEQIAQELGVGLVAIRRNSQFWIDPEEHVTASYINHRDKVTSLITERKLLPAGSRVLLADDWMSTAATMQACTNLIEDAGCKVVGMVAIGADYQSGTKGLIDSGSARIVYCEK